MQESELTLICSCSKCSAQIKVGISQSYEKKKFNTCPACKAHYVLTKESFARRAYRKSGEINCAHCGGKLDHSLFCRSCKAIFPTYYAAEFPGAAKKRARQNRYIFESLRSFSNEWRSTSTSTMDWKKNIVTGVSAVVIVALVAYGVSFYINVKAKKEYAAAYVMALYGIKMGTDLSLNACSKVSADWTIKSSSGQNVPPGITADDEKQLDKIRTQTDKYLHKLNNPPSVFSKSNERLLILNVLFSKLHAAALKPSGTITDFADLTKKTENHFKEGASDLKKNLPPELSEELETVKTKYRGMKDF